MSFLSAVAQASQAGWRPCSGLRTWQVACGLGPYPTIASALAAIAADPVPPSQSNPACVLVHPGLYDMTTVHDIPEWTGLVGVNRDLVQLRNVTTDMFHITGPNVSLGNFTILGAPTESLWAIKDDNYTNLWLYDLTMTTDAGVGKQGLLYTTGATYIGIRLDRLWLSSRRTGSYAIILENTSGAARDIDVQFTNFMMLCLYTTGGGCIQTLDAINTRFRDMELRSSGRCFSIERPTASGTPSANIMFCLGAGAGTPLYTAASTSVTIDNSSLPGSSINGASTTRNSTV